MTKEHPKLTTEEIYSVLVAKIGNSNFELVNYDLKELNRNIGLLGDHGILSTSVNIFINKEAQQKDLKSFSFFVKFFPTYEAQANFCKETGAFKKEVFMYDLFETIRSAGITYIDTVPKCYFSKENYALVIENLTEKGYKTLDKMKTLDYHTVLVVLKTLAKLHASSIIYEETKSKELERTYRLSDDYEENFEESFYSDRENFVNIEGVKASINALCSEVDIFKLPEKLESGKDFKAVLRENCYRIYDLVKRNDKYRNVICHGDLWSTNFLIKFNPDDDKPIDCKLVDFQYGRLLPPSHDVVSLLYLTTSREFRRTHMYEMLGLYYTNLEKYLKLSNVTLSDILTIQDFLTSCEKQKFFAMFQAATYFQLVLVDNEKLERFFADSKTNEETFFEDRTPLILGNIKDNEIYRERLIESMMDLKEYCDRI